ncbi:fungal-specific transcription factor domain-containing protein [Dactylonectria estremocensis]|uniref:Fungal-specific transcription factor domain-containing protein n=1 Tax=Dactylonectria estremocensis TaxID=1079267 RepID=A0A9P9FEJ9_9HYPO|nr:fungal-specific transcription factor domain-containing protein [Dactylonectria estremocensis]
MDLRKRACGACRARKIRCSRQMPRCAACRRSNLNCTEQKSSNDLIWLSRHDDGDRKEVPSGGNGLRRHCIFTDEQRIKECGVLQHQLSKRNIDATLCQVDEAALQDLTERGHSVSIGPFGAFQVSPVLSLPPSPIVPAPSINDTNTTNLTQNLDSITSPLSYHNQGELLGSSNSVVDNWGDLGNLFEPLPPQWPTYPFFEDLVGFPGATLAEMSQDIVGEEYQEVKHTVELTPDGELTPATGLVSATFLNEPTQLEIVLDSSMSLSINKVQLLLRNYELDLVNSLTPMKHDKPPWVLLHLKCALAAFSDLYMMGRSNDARVSVLLSVLSTSAFHLHHKLASIPGASDDLAVLGNQCFRLAKKRLQACLQKRAGTSKVAKYKEMLMAFLNLVTACVFSGQMQEARYFILDAGRLINAYGIQKAQKSKKVIILHAIYVYMRVFEECAHPCSNIRLASDAANSTSSASEASCYASMWKHDPRKDMLFPQAIKPGPETNTSILPHDLEVASMLEKIYGIPQNLFHLLWQTTALGNEVSEVRYTSGLTAEMSLRVKELDEAIMSFENPYLLKGQGQAHEITSSASSRQGGEEEEERRKALRFDLTEAIHSALIIYFYRHVCDVSLMVLQHFVEKTARSLFRYETQKQEYGDTSPGICWPAFIASCEASNVELREELSIWLLNNAQSSGIGMFSTAHDFVVEVWRAREAPGCENVHWKSVVTYQDTRLVLT